MKDDRRAADDRLKKEQEKVERALQAARNAGDKDRQVKDLAAQIENLSVCMWERFYTALSFSLQCIKQVQQM